MKKNILLIGSGGREHALAWAIKQSKHTAKLFCIPGNAGISSIAECHTINPDAFDKIVEFCLENKVDLVVVGPEVPLVAGITDFLESKGIKVFGPSKKAAALEGSKKFMKDICAKYNIPTAEYKAFTKAEEAKSFIKESEIREPGKKFVIKADGLAAGKGVLIPENAEEAIQAVDEVMGGKFGNAGETIVIEEFLEGEEASFFAISDGETAIAFGSAQDHKRVGEGDTGLNTGGMGTYSPAPIVTDEMQQKIMQDIINPTMDAMQKEGIKYKGVLFAGLMIVENEPKLLEFNIRFGDPETQVLMPLLDGNSGTDIVELFLAACNGSIGECKIKLKDKAAMCVVMAANGYPESYNKGTEIKNLETAEAVEDVIIFHAGTRSEGGKILANGGRVLGITGVGNNVAEAREKAYRSIDLIEWPGGFCRRDIGWRVLSMNAEKMAG